MMRTASERDALNYANRRFVTKRRRRRLREVLRMFRCSVEDVLSWWMA